jgi:hypothetical protein
MPTRKTPNAVVGFALVLGGCATAPSSPPRGALEQARSVTSYSARLSISLKGSLRGRAAALVAFERPDALRVEIPGPSGARLLAVAKGSSLLAVFPAEKAVWEGPATAEGMDALLGVPLAPPEVMDFLLGIPVPRLSSYRVWWGSTLPRRIEATLPDGGAVKALVLEADSFPLPDTAFAEPLHVGYRRLASEEVRSLWRPR